MPITPMSTVVMPSPRSPPPRRREAGSAPICASNVGWDARPALAQEDRMLVRAGPGPEQGRARSSPRAGRRAIADAGSDAGDRSVSTDVPEARRPPRTLPGRDPGRDVHRGADSTDSGKHNAEWLPACPSTRGKPPIDGPRTPGWRASPAVSHGPRLARPHRPVTAGDRRQAQAAGRRTARAGTP